MKPALVICLLAFLIPTVGFSAGETPCEKAFLKSLTIESWISEGDAFAIPPQLSRPEEDICKYEEGSLTKLELHFLSEIKDVAVTLANYIGFDPAHYSTRPIDMTITLNVGVFGGVYDPDDNSLKINFTPVSLKRSFDKALFSHELMHYILDSAFEGVPKNMSAASQSRIWGEGYPDLVTYAVYGSRGDNHANFSDDFERLPLMNFSQRKIEYRRDYGSYKKMKKCTAFYEMDEADIPDSEKINLRICEDATPQEIMEAEFTFDEVSQTDLFSLPVSMSEFTDLGKYSMAGPLNLFLMGLKKNIKKDIFKEFLSASKNTKMEKYSCGFKSYESKNRLKQSYTSVLKILANLRKNLSDTGKKAYDKAFETHELAKYAVLEVFEKKARFSFNTLLYYDENKKEDSAAAKQCEDSVQLFYITGGTRLPAAGSPCSIVCIPE